MVVGTGLGHSHGGGQGRGVEEGERKWKTGREERAVWQSVAKNYGGTRAAGLAGQPWYMGLGVSGLVGTGWACERVMRWCDRGEGSG